MTGNICLVGKSLLRGGTGRLPSLYWNATRLLVRYDSDWGAKCPLMDGCTGVF